MPATYDAARQHARLCALNECCTTADLAAQALNCTPDAARAALKLAADAGYLRAGLLPSLGNRIVYQPTPKAVGLRGIVPKFLRAGLSGEARLRGLLRGHARFATRPGLSYLSAAEQSELCRRHGVPERGYARALVGLDGAHAHILVTVTRSEAPAAAIEAAATRWLPLLDPGAATLHFVAPAGEPTVALRNALAAMSGGDLRAELDAIDAQIAADRSGLAAIRMAAQRAALAAEVEAAGEPDGACQWLGDVIEAEL